MKMHHLHEGIAGVVPIVAQLGVVDNFCRVFLFLSDVVDEICGTNGLPPICVVRERKRKWTTRRTASPY
jgi:hypothetical protein